MSDGMSLSSFGSPEGGGGGGSGGRGPVIVAEEIGGLSFPPDFNAKKIVVSHCSLAALNEDGSKLLLGEIRFRGDGDCLLMGKSITLIDKSNEKKYLDMALVSGREGKTRLVFLAERIKNKERLLVGHSILRGGKALELGEESASYDKANVLGKGVSHIIADNVSPSSAGSDIYSASNLLRKLKVEEPNGSLKPTSARAHVSQECLDGTISLAIQSCYSKSPKTFLAGAFRTKSATKNKFMIEWFLSSSNNGERIASARFMNPVKFEEDCEPLYLLTDPKDSRTVYVVCKTGSNNHSLYKLTDGLSKKYDEPILTWNGPADGAAIGLSPDQVTILLIYELNQGIVKLYSLTKSEGFRGRHPQCAHCPSLESLQSPSHVVSCSSPNQKWQISSDLLSSSMQDHQICLATLVDGNGKFIPEPETGNVFRVRILGCETQGVHAEAILLEDLSRTFENAEDQLSGLCLKICINSSPCRDCQSLLSGWLMSGKLGSIALQYVQTEEIPLDFGDRFSSKPISIDRFKSYIADTDWTQMYGGSQKQGTFTKNDEQLPSSTSSPLNRSFCGRSPRSSVNSAPGSRIPTRSSLTSGCPMTTSTPNYNNNNNTVCNNNKVDVGDTASCFSSSHSDIQSEHVKELMANVSTMLQNVLSSDSSLRNNLICLENSVQELQQSMGP